MIRLLVLGLAASSGLQVFTSPLPLKLGGITGVSTAPPPETLYSPIKTELKDPKHHKILSDIKSHKSLMEHLKTHRHKKGIENLEFAQLSPEEFKIVMEEQFKLKSVEFNKILEEMDRTEKLILRLPQYSICSNEGTLTIRMGADWINPDGSKGHTLVTCPPGGSALLHFPSDAGDITNWYQSGSRGERTKLSRVNRHLGMNINSKGHEIIYSPSSQGELESKLLNILAMFLNMHNYNDAVILSEQAMKAFTPTDKTGAYIKFKQIKQEAQRQIENIRRLEQNRRGSEL